jgi:hypothetical protein
MLLRYLSFCRENNKVIALVDFNTFDKDVLSDYACLLKSLATEISVRFKLALPERQIKKQQMFNHFIEYHLLSELNNYVIIAFDNIERIMNKSYSEDFFAMLRMWHDKRAEESGQFCRLGIAMAHSTEAKLFIRDPLRSPFTVAEKVSLVPFTVTETKRLNDRYGKPLLSCDCLSLCQLVSGHPYLIHEALYNLCRPNPLTIEMLRENAAKVDGPFGGHLKAILYNVTNANLLPHLCSAINDGNIDEDAFYRLEAAGLLRRKNGQIIPANDVYAEFFRRIR